MLISLTILIPMFLIALGFFIKYLIKRKYLKLVNSYFNELKILKQSYISYNDLAQFKDKYSELNNKIFNKYYDADDFQSFLESYANLDNNRKMFNVQFLANELIKYDKLFSDVDKKSLDDQQRESCIINEDANLVIAGAGSGKTLTICGKIKYLLEKGVKPENILCISFTNKVCDELSERLKKICGQSIDVMTFHKVALKILEQHKKKYGIADENKSNRLIEKIFTGITYKELTYQNLYALICAECYTKDHTSSATNLYTMKDLIEHVMQIRELRWFEKNSIHLETLQTEKVKSEHELDIANFLFLNGIKYEYEQPYKSETKDKINYNPDFYLPEYNIYIEHFGIDESGTASWLKDPIAIKKYTKDMNWKIEFHKKENNSLVCTYSYERSELLNNLQKKLEELGVEFHPCSTRVIELFNEIGDYGHFMIKTITSFIKLFKSKNYPLIMFHNFLTQNEKYNLSRSEKRLLLVIQKVYLNYQTSLIENNLMDFDDIINLANGCFKNAPVASKYKYIIVDEYQDVSPNKVELLKNLLNVNSAKLMCVGDDWQSIYRFAGSEVSLISNFEQIFPHTAITKIERTYRNSQELIDIASKFIQKNKNQLQKKLFTNNHIENPIEVVSFNDTLTNIPKELDESIKNDIIKTSLLDPRYQILIDILDKCNSDKQKNILLLTRNNDDYSIIKFWLQNEDSALVCKKNSTNQLIFTYKNLTVSCMTIHKSKGLEADDTIIFGLREGNRGLPDTLGSEAILRVVTSSKEPVDYAEDRRLFYVALTRTKGKVYIISNHRMKSQFLTELISDNKKIPHDCDAHTCPLCNGYLVKIDQYGFYGCSNYSTSKCQFKLFAETESHMRQKNMLIKKFIPLWKNNKHIEVYGKIQNLTKQVAPRGNLCIKIEFELFYNSISIGTLTTYVNRNSTQIETQKLEQFINTIGTSNKNVPDPFENFDDFYKQSLNKQIKLFVKSDSYGQFYEHCEQNGVYYSPYKK